jgi:hypothetical protein
MDKGHAVNTERDSATFGDLWACSVAAATEMALTDFESLTQ